ncbi:hypothetical protein NDU88_001599 [Pleurodeles waltl]|uniref:Uncharacterized protein n=1 Tax=Pleurodeles waltl TaxID=8319 RepID=A0AAV7KQM5_PLEWA|nr:hypothetical protein NDU88_001599 [Pleurodeles waltl]
MLCECEAEETGPLHPNVAQGEETRAENQQHSAHLSAPCTLIICVLQCAGHAYMILGKSETHTVRTIGSREWMSRLPPDLIQEGVPVAGS